MTSTDLSSSDGEEPSAPNHLEVTRRSIVIATLTFRRPQGISDLLPALVEQAILITSPTTDVRVLVVDNDDVPSARTLVESAADRSTAGSKPTVHYEHEPRPGISAARNRALDFSHSDDILVFIDDDCLPSQDWLRLLLETFDRYEPAGVVGRMVPRYESEPDPWIVAGGFFVREQKPTGSEVPGGATNNLLLDLRIVRALGVRFDDDLGLIGGEDSLFTNQIRREGGRFIWCNEATAVDNVPKSRLTRRWVLRRRFRFGAGEVLIRRKLAQTAMERLGVRILMFAKAMAGLIVGLGLVLAGLLTTSLRWRAHGSAHIARALGRLSGVAGIQYHEYRR